MADDAQIVLRAYTAQLDTDLKQATGSIQKFADSMRSSLSSAGTQWKAIPQAANEVDKGLGGLMGTLKEFKAEQVQQGRAAKFFANEIAGIVPVSGAASGALQGVLSAGLELAGGITKAAAVFAAFELVKAGLELVHEQTKINATQMQALGSLGKIHTDVIRAGMESVLGPTRDAATIQAAYNATMAAGAGPLKAYDAELKKVADAGISTWAKLNDIFGDGSLRQAYSETLGAIRAKAAESEKALRALADESASFASTKRWMEEANREQAHRDEMERQADAQRADQVKKAKEAIQEIAQAQAAAWTAMELGNLGPGDYAKSMASQPDWMKNAGKVGRMTTSQEADSYSQVEIDMVESQGQVTAMEKLRTESQQATQEMSREWVGVGANIAEATGKAFAGVIKGTMSVASAFKVMAASAVNSVIEMVKKAIMAYAAEAAAAAYAKNAIVPFIGPALGMAAAVAAMTTVQSFLPSAATGWDKLPSDQIVQLHKGERVTPAYDVERQDRLEAALLGGGGGHTFHIYAHDARSFDQYLRDNRVSVVRALTSAAKDGVRG